MKISTVHNKFSVCYHENKSRVLAKMALRKSLQFKLLNIARIKYHLVLLGHATKGFKSSRI